MKFVDMEKAWDKVAQGQREAVAIIDKAIEKGDTAKDWATKLGITESFLCDVRKGRRLFNKGCLKMILG